MTEVQTLIETIKHLNELIQIKDMDGLKMRIELTDKANDLRAWGNNLEDELQRLK